MADAPVSIETLLDEGRRLHRAGQVSRAEPLYRQALQINPRHPEALHLFGVAASALGKLPEAVESLQQAIALQPAVAKYHLNLGLALRRGGRMEEALAAYRRAIELQPDLAEAHLNLGIALKLIERLPEAVATLRRALELDPKLAEAAMHLGEALRVQGQPEQALTPLRQAVALKPHLADAHGNLALCYVAMGRPVEAVRCCERMFDLDENDFNALQISSGALRSLGDYAEAEVRARRATELRPADVHAHLALGHTLYEQAKFADATREYDRAIELKPDMAEAHSARGLIHLLQGNLAEGFNELDWLWRVPEYRAEYGRAFTAPLWNGEPLPGRTLLVHADGGHGDVLQFIRYVPWLRPQVGRLVVECQPALVRLLRMIPGIDAVLARGTELPPFDRHVPILSLPRIAGTTLPTIPGTVPYLRVPPDTALKLPRVDGGERRVGLVWAGNPEHRRDPERSVPVQLFVPFVRTPGVHAFSLQTGDAAAGVQLLQAAGRVTDLSLELTDFAETAAAVAALDLVITVDTAVAHLAGALGRPVWLFVPFLPDWRWMLERADSPWYPTAVLYRQHERGSWEAVAQAMHRQLEKWVAEPR